MSKIICRRGDRGASVRTVQRLLHLDPDGYFGKLTEEAVITFQKENGLTADGIVGVSTWARLVGTMILPCSRKIDKIIIHCTATPAGKDYDVEDVRRWHRAQGWNDIGYHWLILRSGELQKGRDEDKIGAHCYGQNAHSIGIAYVGGMTKDGKKAADSRTRAQVDTMHRLVSELKKVYPGVKVYGHRDFDARKDCPSFDVGKEEW